MAKLKKFNAFVGSLFPSEVAYVMANNAYADKDLFAILEKVKLNLDHPEKTEDFDVTIDARKYSKLMKSMEQKLAEIDVDAYFEWISQINHLITIDEIPPKEQGRILKEMQNFEPGWFHMKSFYGLLKNYEGYLLRRLRRDEFEIVRSFLLENREVFRINDEVAEEVSRLTESIAFRHSKDVAHADIDRLLGIFRNEGLSKKNRYEALLAFMMHHINRKQVDLLVEPMAELEAAIFRGSFYSRRILANFYANKLIVAHMLKNYESAIYCGYQSVKHRTQDHLYYLNNLVSSLLHTERHEEALAEMRASFSEYKLSRDLNRKTVFISNYCRCLNMGHRFAKSVSLASSFLDENKQKLSDARWHYFFRVYFQALLRLDDGDRILRLNKRWKLEEREEKENMVPYLRAMVLAAKFREIKVSQREFLNGLEAMQIEKELGFRQLLQTVKDDAFPG